MSFSKRQGNDAVCYTKPLDSLKSWNDRFFWVDTFACPASFPWNTSKSASKDPFPKSSQYNAEHYATLVAYPAPFHKVEMDLLSFIQTADPTKVRIGERQRAEGKPKLLDTTMGHVVPLLPVSPAVTAPSSELRQVWTRHFDRSSGSHAEQGDSVSGGHGVGVPQVSKTAEIIAEDAALVQPRRQRKRKTVVSDAGEPSHPPKKLREDHGTSTGANLRAITAPPRFVISSDSSHHLGTNIAEAKVDSFARPSVPLMTMTTTVTSTVDPTTTAKEKFVESSIFGGGSSSGAEHTVGGFSGLTGSDFIVGVGWKHDELFTEFNVGAARQISLSAEVRMHAEFNIREKRRLSAFVEEKKSLLKARDEEGEKSELDVKLADLAATVKVREQEVADLDDVVTSIKVHNDNLSDQYLSSLGAAIGKAVEKGMQEGLSAGITHGAAGRVLTDVAAYNPSAEADYLSALQRLQSVNFSLITELKSNKDASIDTIMNLLCLEDSLAERLGLTESQPRVDQLMVPIHHSPDQRVIGASALSLSLDVSSSRVQRIRENIANHRSALRDS
ncbi:hypothetical protein Tco_0103876 [Tanacetum coccineum]